MNSSIQSTLSQVSSLYRSELGTLGNGRVRHLLNSNEINLDAITPLLSTTWEIYSVSPLYRLNNSKVYLKRASKWLREQLNSMLAKSNKNTTCIVKFKIMEFMNSVDIPALQLTIHDENNNRVIYQCNFLTTKKSNLNTEKFVYLPTLLCRSSMTTANKVHILLQKLFDCRIVKLQLPSMDMKWLTAIFCTNTDFGKDSRVVLKYSINKANIKLTFLISQLDEIWSKILSTSVKQINTEQIKLSSVQKFHSVLCNITMNNSGINLNKLQLTEVRIGSTALISLSKIKTSEPFILSEYLFFIQDLVRMPQLDFYQQKNLMQF